MALLFSSEAQPMKLFVWKNSDGYHLSRPLRPSKLTEVEFDPRRPCRECDEKVLSISADGDAICPWCDSSMNRPKMLPYQETEIIRLMQRKSDENRHIQASRKPKLIRYGSTERDLRDFLTANGYSGRSASILSLDLRGLERPGWVQLFEFHVHAKALDGGWEHLRGTCRCDERIGQFQVDLFDAPNREAAIERATDGMITTRRPARHWSYWPLMGLFAVALGLAMTGAILTPEQPQNPSVEGPVEADES